MAPLTIGRFESDNSPSSDVIVGIDLGTTNSLIAICENGVPRVLKDENGQALVPSVVHWGEQEDHPIVGRQAKSLRFTDAGHTAYSVKRFMGRGRSDLDQKNLAALDTSLSTEKNVLIKLGNKSLSAIELSSEVLKKLKLVAETNLKTKIQKAVITVPAYFNESQRAATRAAGQLAGLEVVRIVNEPTAAALAYGLDKKKNDLIAVYDLGGGTFDISILKLHDGIFEVLSTNGDTVLGGDDFDNILAQKISDQVPKLREVLAKDLQWRANLIEIGEKLKIQLSDLETAKESLILDGQKYEITISRKDFETAISSLVSKTIEISKLALSDAELSPQDIGDVVMVGGSTRIPLVREKVRELFGIDLNTSVNPDEVVALGAAVQADILSGHNKDMVLLDIVPLSLGIETYGGTIGKIILRNTKIPALAKETFTTHVDGQRNVLIHVLQGERELASDCRSLARFDLKGLPPMPAGLPKIEVIFLIDANGLLKVSAKELTTQTESHVEIKPSYGLTDEDVEKMLQSSFDHAESDMKNRQLIDTRVEAEGILRSAAKLIKEGEALNLTHEVSLTKNEIQNVVIQLKGDDYVAIRKALDSLEEKAKPLAEKVMNHAVQVIKQKNVTDVLGKEEK